MQKLLIVGWDAADWKVITPLLEEGHMPNVKHLIETGVKGNMATLYPMLSPMLWTTIATGKRPFNHGIHGFAEPDPSGPGVRPITNLSRSTRALWNIATVMGLKSNVIGWWPSQPVEPIDGAMVSDHYYKATAPFEEPWPMRPGTVHPPRIAKNLADLRIHPQALNPGLVQLFLPKLFEMDQVKEKRVTSCAKIIAECSSICNAAEALMHHEPWTITCAYFSSIDHFGHGFMNFHPPKLEWVSEKDFDYYNQVVRSGYIYHDILLGRLLQQTDEKTTVMLLSDHGFHSDHLRPRNLSHEPAGPADQHRHYGVFVMAGPGIKKDELIFGATLLDVCPTALAVLGLPVGEDMEGKVLDVFETPREIQYLTSWDDIEGEDGMHPEGARLDPGQAEESLRQLVELGYIGEIPEDRTQAVEECVRELRYNLARSYMDAALHIEAVPLLEELHARWPYEFRFGVLLANCYLALDRADEAADLIERVAENKKEDMVKARESLKAFMEEHKEQMEKAKAGEGDALPEKEQHKLRKLRARSGGDPMALSYLRGVIAAAQKDYDNALRHLELASQRSKDDLRILLKLGEVYFSLNKLDQSLEMYRRAQELDPENALAWLGIARGLLAQNTPAATAEAEDAAQHAVGLLYYYPLGHYTLGIARQRLGKTAAAVKSFDTAAAQNPNFPEVYDSLAEIAAAAPRGRAKAKRHRKAAIDARARIRALQAERKTTHEFPQDLASLPLPENNGPKFSFEPGETVVIVSGLPRSGTSLMMQMLAAGGVEPLTDGTRAADINNPKGYYELEVIKTLWKDNTWMDDAKGKSIKVIANLLPSVKPGLKYKIIFMWRDMEEILRSQTAMLQQTGHTRERNPAALAKTFNRQLKRLTQWILKSPHVDVCFVDYAATVANPAETAHRLNNFLAGTLEVDEMVAAVSPELHRQRKA